MGVIFGSLGIYSYNEGKDTLNRGYKDVPSIATCDIKLLWAVVKLYHTIHVDNKSLTSSQRPNETGYLRNQCLMRSGIEKTSALP